jgi:Leucine-rich repeat (LRR) protein
LIQTPTPKKLQLSTNTRHLLAQHLHWVNNGYDIIKINEVIKTISNEDPFCATTLYQIERKLGTSNNTDFELEELEKLTYFYPCLIKFDGNLDFLKYCKNLKEVDFGCLNLEDISDLAYLKDLTNLNLCNNNINNINSLATLENLEEINLGGCNPFSLKPLLQLKKIRKIVLDDVENEDDVFEIISNQKACSIEYLVSNNSVLHGITFSKFWVFIYLNEEKVNISMTSIVTDKWSRFCEIPTGLIEDNSFLTAYKELLNTELDKRINAVLKSNYEILEESKRYTEQEIEFEVELKIKRL